MKQSDDDLFPSNGALLKLAKPVVKLKKNQQFYPQCFSHKLTLAPIKMILTNFEIEDMIGIRYSGQYFDLHNDFAFNGFKYSVAGLALELEWAIIDNEADGIVQNQIHGLILLFSNVNYLRIQERDFEMPVSEDKCLSVIGYLPQEMRDVMDSFGDKPDYEDDDMIMMFQGGQTFKINATQVELIPKK
ncbi:hypothetical protein D770_05000 [Flammeovirgaceae bacterium 311]|nr:hypothetical protein D770_05000 [Flammeovirgaceae bacterium 311]